MMKQTTRLELGEGEIIDISVDYGTNQIIIDTTDDGFDTNVSHAFELDEFEDYLGALKSYRNELFGRISENNLKKDD